MLDYHYIGGVKMELLTLIGTYFTNAFIVLYFYLQVYSAEIILLGLLLFCVYVEYKEKAFLFIDDERKII